jgi:hypothetical protein
LSLYLLPFLFVLSLDSHIRLHHISSTMSFLGGAECSTAGNPLTQFTKHVQDDKSLHRDRLVGRGPGMQEGMRSRGMMGGQDQVRSLMAFPDKAESI